MATTSRATGRQVPTDLSPTGKLIYLYLVQQDRATAEELKGALAIPQIRLYPTLEALERQELIERAGGEFAVPR